MAVLINAYATIGSPHTRRSSCSGVGHVVAVTSNEVEDDAAVSDLVVGMCYPTTGQREFGYWANDNASRFHDALAKVTSDLPGGPHDPFYAFVDCNPLQATFGPESCGELAEDFASFADEVRPRLLALDDGFGAYYDHLRAAYAYARDGGMVLFA